jgi:hypothetical protein
MKANQLFAEKAQISTENMESMTHDMHEIAIKTKQETVSMRIITLVTLFFLPGTFISVILFNIQSVSVGSEIDRTNWNLQLDNHEYRYCSVSVFGFWAIAGELLSGCLTTLHGDHNSHDGPHVRCLVRGLSMGRQERDGERATKKAQ